ncbi:hypothetical protein MXE38_02890 [Anaerobiospirillum sp. NML120448]|uniref:hypothetical protein n=1 Tax=Anaerobiospirillum sp. NML120448 TaxID=2932816 RepID=UPI001FF0FD59|nr:hypothetical protein [Anaerobiospirillum sp. NML120448]MCK0513817.1 hypothetical protein [Anaerobiospirillum sp. NML120448]
MKNNKQENSAHNLALMRGLAKLKSMQQRQEQEQADAIEAHLLATKISLKAPAKAPTPSPALRKVTTSLNLEEMESLHKAQDSAIDANTISYQESANKQSIERAASLLKKATSRNHDESSAPSALAVSALKKQPQISATPELSASFVDSQSQHLKDTNTVIADGDSAHAWPLNEDPLSSTTATPTTTTATATATTSANLAALNATLASPADADIDADAATPANDSASTHETNNSTSTEVKDAKANTKTSSLNSETVKSKTKSITKAKAARLNPKDKELHITSGQEHNLSHAQNAQDTSSSAKVLYSASSMQEPNNLDALELNNATMRANVTLDNNQALSIKATSELISATQKVAHSQAPAPSATVKVKPVAANTSDHQNDDALPEAPINSAQPEQPSADNTTTESLPEDMTSSSSASSNQKETETALEAVTVTDTVIEAIAEPVADNTTRESLPEDMVSSSTANREQKEAETAQESVTVTDPVIEAIAEPVADNTSTESLPEDMVSSSTANKEQKETETAQESVTVTDPVIEAIAEPLADNTTTESLPEDMASSSTANKEPKDTDTAQESVVADNTTSESLPEDMASSSRANREQKDTETAQESVVADNTTSESLPEDMASSSRANREQKETETAQEAVTVTDHVIEAIAEPLADNTASESLPEDMASSSTANREQKETETAQESVTVTTPVIEAIAEPLADNTSTESLPEDMVSSSTANKEQKETETALEAVTVTDPVIETIADTVADNTSTASLPEDIASSSSANREQETEGAAVQENSKDVLKGDKESRTKVKSTKSSLGNSASAGAEVEAGAGASTGAGAGAEEQIASEVKRKAKGKKGGNAYARNYSEFVRLFGSSSASIKERTVDLIEHVFQAESEILGERYEYTLKDHEVFCLEQNLFGSGLNLADTGVDKQVSLLELLLVLLSQNQNVLEHRHVSNSSEVKYSFIKRQALTLRRIVFNNPMVERINTSQGTDDEKWLSWQRDFNEFNQKSDANFKLDTNHYHLLKRAFHNFDNFTKAITLLRSWAIVPNKAKAWTEHFLFPFGAESLYYDTTDMLAKGASNHCTNFGQLLFTMLMRAHPKSTPDQQNALLMLCDCFFEQHEGFNVFAQLLGDSFSSGEDEIIAHLRSQLPEDSNSTDQSWSSCSNVFKQASQNLLQECEFVPYKEHRCFDQLEEDFRQLLSLNLTKQQLLKSLSVMGMLNILIYFLEQEQRLASINNSKNVPNIDLVLSLGNKASPRVAKLSLDRLQANDKLHSIALNNFITQRLYLLIRCCVSYFKEDLKLDPKEQDLVCNLTRVAFNFVTHKAITIDLNGKGSIYVQDNISSKELASSHKKAHNPLNRVQESQPYPSYKNVLNTISNALMSHTGNNKSPHRDLAIEIGLISGTQKAHQYYSFSDELLRTLVLCCVDKNKSMIMLSEFLQKLYDRYHIVIGPQQAHYYYSSNTQGRSNHIEEKEFKKNLNELIAQLKRMDLLINLSDSCEYVTNPFSIHS